jgi:uncharacterized protein
MALKINIHDIREEKSGQIKGCQTLEPLELDLPCLQGLNWHPFSFDYVLTNADSLFVLQGRLESTLSLECSRCLKPVETTFSVDVLEEFTRHASGARDEEIREFFGEEIDATGVLREIILLSLPVKPLCSPDCQGLCPYCGIDKNVDSCTCKPDSVDPRLAVLAKLISK